MAITKNITGEKFWTGTEFLTDPTKIAEWEVAHPGEFDPLAMQAPDQEPITPIAGVHFNPLFSPPAITPEALKPVAPIDFKIPEEPTVFPVADLDITPPLLPTPEEKRAIGISTELQELSERLIGQAAFRTEREEARGLPALEQTQTDLTAQLKAIQAEAKAIPLQLQQEAIGRGITVGGLRPLETARLRTNAIQALSISSLLEASRGNIALAQTQVDRAVAQKFDPIKEEIAVKRANLQLIIESPAYTLQQQNRAQRQLDVQALRLRDLIKEEATETAIKNIAVQAAQKGADAMTLGRIQAATSEVEATRIAEAAGVLIDKEVKPFTLSPGQTRFDAEGNIVASVIKPTGSELDELLSPNELALFNAPAGSTMRDILGQIPKEELTGVQKFTQEIKLGKEFEKLVGESRKAATAVENINASLVLAEDAIINDSTLNPASQGILVAFQKLLDPTSVVRESEYARSGNGQSLWNNIAGRWQKIVQGGAGVTIEELRAFVDTANVFLKGYQNTALKHAKRMQIIAERQELDLPSILTEDMINLLDRGVGGIQVQFNTIDDFLRGATNEQLDAADSLRQSFPDMSDDDLLELINEQRGFNQVGGDTNRAVGVSFRDKRLARTDRHNNPIAVAVRSGGTNEFTDALDKAGIKWEHGDEFPKNPNMVTISIEGDPVEASRIVLANSGAIQNWYINHTGKDILRRLGIKNNKDFRKLSKEDQDLIIKSIYNNEGNKGLLNAQFV